MAGLTARSIDIVAGQATSTTARTARPGILGVRFTGLLRRYHGR